MKKYNKEERHKEYMNNIERYRESNRAYRKNNSEILKIKKKQYNIKNKDKLNIYFRNYYKKNNVNILNTIKDKTKNDAQFAARKRTRCALQTAINTYRKSGKIPKSRNYPIDYAAIIEHLKPFPNDKEYEVDHIIPLYKFDLTKTEHIKLAFTPTNHRWLHYTLNRKRNLNG